MENVLERMERIDAKKKIADFMVKEQMPYSFKVKYARIRAEEFMRECDARGLNYLRRPPQSWCYVMEV